MPRPAVRIAGIGPGAIGFDNDRGAIEQFREREVPHPEAHEWRRVIWLTPRAEPGPQV